MFIFHLVLHPSFCCCHAQEVTLLLLCFCGLCLCYRGCHTQLSFLSHAALSSHSPGEFSVNTYRDKWVKLGGSFARAAGPHKVWCLILKGTWRPRGTGWWEDRHTFFHHPTCPQDSCGFSEAWCSTPKGQKYLVSLDLLVVVNQSDQFVSLCFVAHIFLRSLFVLSFPAGLLVEIRDGECGHRGPGAGTDWGPRGQNLSRRSFRNGRTHSNIAEEAAGSPQVAHAPRGGAGGALQCGAGEWTGTHLYCTHK